MNTALRDALVDARMTRHDLARRVDVVPKTVDRWLGSQGRAPHRGTQLRVAEALGVSADMLWPQAVRAAVKTGADREIVTVYPTRNQCPTSVWSALIDGAKRQITFAGYTSYFLWQEQPRIAERLAAKAAAGCRIRFLLGDPASEVTRRREAVENVPLSVSTRIETTLDQLRKMGPQSGIEARFSDQHVSLSVCLFDKQGLVSQHIANRLGHDSPTMHLRRLQPDGWFDQFAQHVEILWEGGRPVPDVGAGS